MNGLNGLLVIRQIDNTSPGGAPGEKLVPGSLNRCERGHTVSLFKGTDIWYMIYKWAQDIKPSRSD